MTDKQLTMPDVFKGEGPMVGPNRVVAVLRLYAGQGRNLADIATPRVMGRKIETLKRYCSTYDIAFPDWTPLRMRPAKPPKPKKQRKRKTP